MTNVILSDLRFIKADKMYLIFVCGILPATKDFALWSIDHPGVTKREILQGASHYIMNNRINFTRPNHQLYKPEEVLELVNDGCENAIKRLRTENPQVYLGDECPGPG